MNHTQKKASGAKLLAAFGAAALLACGATASFAGENASAAGKVQGMQVAIDPATGKIRQPTAAEIKALSTSLQTMLNRSAESVQINQGPDGTLSATLGTSYLNVWLAAVHPDGSIGQACVDSADSAAAALQPGPALEVK